MRRSPATGVVACAAMSIASWCAGPAFAQQAGGGSGPAGFGVGPLLLVPGIDFALGHDDNIYYSNANRRSSGVRIFSPYVRLEGAPTPHKFDASLRYDFGRYSGRPDDDYEDYSLNSNADLVFTGRSGLRLRAEHRRGHDPRGSTDRPFGAEPDVYKNTGGEGLFRYGAQGARGGIELDGGHFERRYQNNRPITEASDYSQGSGGATFLWRVAPRTELLFQGQRRNYDYKLATSTLDSTENRFYGGARWQATAATSGSVKIGRLKKDFHDPARHDVSAGSWDVGVRWSPRTYSAVDLATSKATTESTGLGDTILTRTHGLSWTHDWSSRFRSQLLGSLRNDKYQGFSREDNTVLTGVKLNYQFRRWLRFGVDYLHTKRDSDVQTFDYTRNVILFTVGATL
jgi:hypothetical protein